MVFQMPFDEARGGHEVDMQSVAQCIAADKCFCYLLRQNSFYKQCLKIFTNSICFLLYK